MYYHFVPCVAEDGEIQLHQMNNRFCSSIMIFIFLHLFLFFLFFSIFFDSAPLLFLLLFFCMLAYKAKEEEGKTNYFYFYSCFDHFVTTYWQPRRAVLPPIQTEREREREWLRTLILPSLSSSFFFVFFPFKNILYLFCHRQVPASIGAGALVFFLTWLLSLLFFPSSTFRL